ncbi:hypothetical protein F5Y16DRAFT_339099 [Xylariaceae sp. FL0255]|nr:hypothetical protein F5Y16DRAFT_339099 [Xylariaceae sp. FL0255]
MDLQIDMLEDDFSFCNSSGSFSSASTTSSSQEVFTPTSGCSTPGIPPMLMDHESMTSSGFSLTPPPSTFGGYYASEAKSEASRYPTYDTMSATPSRKTSVQNSVVDFDFAHLMITPSAGSSHQPANHPNYGHYQFGDRITSPPLDTVPPPYQEHLGYEISQSWSWPTDSPVNIFDRHDSPGAQLPRDGSLRDRSNVPPPYFQGNDRRQIAINDVQQRTAALQKVQARRTAKRRSQKNTSMMGDIPVLKCEKGAHYCCYPGCESKPFKRQEHMKRHIDTVHSDRYVRCPFCKEGKPKKFNRQDNFRQHLGLHTTKNTGRTEYAEGAQAMLDAMMLQTKQRSAPKRKTMVIKSEKKTL